MRAEYVNYLIHGFAAELSFEDKKFIRISNMCLPMMNWNNSFSSEERNSIGFHDQAKIEHNQKWIDTKTLQTKLTASTNSQTHERF